MSGSPAICLGDADVVARLVGTFLAEFESMLRAKDTGEITPARFVELAQALTRTTSAIFCGRDPRYEIVAGYHDGALSAKLEADIGAFWTKRRSAWNDHPYCVLFEWLAVIAAEKIKLAQGDDMLLEVMLKPSVQYVVRVLAGVDLSADPEISHLK